MPSEPPRVFIPAPGPIAQHFAVCAAGFLLGTALYRVGLWMLGL